MGSRTVSLSTACRWASIALLAGLCACGDTGTGGGIEARPATVEYGTVTTVPVPFYRAKVRLVNEGESDVMVDRIEASDGLSVDMATGAVIPPGRPGQVVVTLDARDRSAEFTGELVIHWRGALPPLHVPVHATIEAGVEAVVGGPEIEIVGPRDWNFGTIQRQAVEYFDFRIRNAGTAPLRILDVETHCGCVQGWVDKPVVQPGEAIPVHVRLTAAVYPGTSPRKTMTVRTDDPDTPILTFIIQGTIQDSFMIEPSPVEFGELPRGRGSAQAVVVRRMRPGLPTASAVRLDHEHLHVDRHAEQETGDVVAALTVRVAPTMPPGPFEARLAFQFGAVDDAGQPIADPVVPVRGSVEGALSVTPTAVNFGLMEVGRVSSRSLRVRKVPDASTLRVQCELSYLSARVEPLDDGARLVLTYAPKFGEGVLTGRVILTDTATGRSRVIPVVVRFAAASAGDEAPQTP